MTLIREADDLWSDSYEEELNLEGRLYEDTEYCWSIVLRNRELDRCTFKRVVFENCDLSNTSWDSAEFQEVIFKNCDLTNASFRKINAEKLVLIECSVNKLDFTGSEIDGFTMEECAGAITAEDTTFIVGKFVDSDLSDSEFSRAGLCWGTFIDCNLSSTCFQGANVEQGEFKECDLSECVMSGALNINTPARMPSFIDCVMNPIGAKDNTWMRELISRPTDKVRHEKQNYSKDAVLYCSDFTEFDSCGL